MRKACALLLALGIALGGASSANAVSGGWYDQDRVLWGPYVDFDRTDQGAIASGAAAGVAASVCIGTTGWACPTSSTIVAGAAFYIAFSGMCPNKLRVYPNHLFGYPMRCV
jgi:hypothetical protein